VSAWLGLAVAFGPLAVMALWMALLNRRDRRRDALEGVVGGCCAELGLRGAFAVQARVGALLGCARVVLDMRLCSAAEIWQVLERLPSQLPPRATLWIVTAPPRCHARDAHTAQAGGIAPVLSTISR